MTNYYSAKHWAEKARKQATGTIAECPEGSAKYWAEIAEVYAQRASTGLPEQSAVTYGKFLQSDENGARWNAVILPTITYWGEE